MYDDNPLESLIGGVIVLLAVCAVAFVIKSCECGSKAGAMGLRSRYRPLSGCIIETKRGIWVPLANYRYLGD